MANAKLELHINGVPELLSAIRVEVADALRESAAECESPEARRELLRIAMAVELGMKRRDA